MVRLEIDSLHRTTLGTFFLTSFNTNFLDRNAKVMSKKPFVPFSTRSFVTGNLRNIKFYLYRVIGAFVANLMADRTSPSDFGSVLFFTAKTRGKRNVCSLRRWFFDFYESNEFFKNICDLRPSTISGLQKLQRNHIGRTSRFGDCGKRNKPNGHLT